MKPSCNQVVLKTKKGVPIQKPIRCDECQKVKTRVKQFAKSNRNFRVNLCADCLPHVIARSFPNTRANNSRDDEYIWNENFDNDDLEISSDDAMNWTVGGGAFESNRRKH